MIYIGLLTLLPDALGHGFEELSGTGYKRQPVVWYRSHADGVLRNVRPVVFPPTKADWPEQIGFGLFDNEEGGILLTAGTFTNKGGKMRAPNGASVTFDTDQIPWRLFRVDLN